MQYSTIVELYEQLDSTTKRLEKTHYISEYIKKLDNPSQDFLLMQGKIYPDWSDKKIGVSSQLIIKALSKSAGMSESKITGLWKKLGDLGDVSEEILSKKKQASLFPRKLETGYVFSSLQSLSEQSGSGSIDKKLNIISDLLINAEPKEAKYLTRTILDNLRLGVGKGTIRDAIVWAFFSEDIGLNYSTEQNDIELNDDQRKKYNEYIERIQNGYDLTNDFSKVLVIIKEGGISGLEEVKLEVSKPVNVMLFPKAKDVEDAFTIVGRPAYFEYKYDGFRVQIHKKEDEIRLFTRRLEEVTEQFPDIVEVVRSHVKCNTCILDAEAVGIDKNTWKPIPFQKISQRIRRKYDIQEVSEEFPVEVNVFDILLYEKEDLIKTEFKVRREIIEKIISEEKGKIVLAEQILTDNNDIAQDFYDKAINKGEEGVMAKSLTGIYKPGARVGYGVKLKSILEPLDLVIVGAEYGEGKRSGMLTSFVLACRDKSFFKKIGKVSTGLKEIDGVDTTFVEMTNILTPFIKKTEGKSVSIRPEIVIEVGYEEIQESANYDSGYALRFPRFLRVRTDEKSAEDCNTLEDVKKLYEQQRGRGNTF